VAALLLTALVVAIEIHINNGRLHHHPKNVPVLNVPGPRLPANLLRAGERVTLHQAARSLH
jgi:hypothetical protein